MTWALKDTWTLTYRALAHWRRAPGPVVVALLFPVLVVLMFGYLFGGQMDVPGGDYFAFLMPGMFALAMLFGLESTMTAVTLDAGRGVTGRLRSMPIAAGAVVAGRAVADVLHSVAGLAVLMVTGLLVGWTIEGTAADALQAVVLLLGLRVALVWAGIYLGLVVRDPQAVAAVQILVWPVGFLSSAFVDPASMPDWLGTIAALNPVSAAATAARDLFGNPAIADASWATEHAMLLAMLWPLVLTAIFAPLAVRRYQRLGD